MRTQRLSLSERMTEPGFEPRSVSPVLNEPRGEEPLGSAMPDTDHHP